MIGGHKVKVRVVKSIGRRVGSKIEMNGNQNTPDKNSKGGGGIPRVCADTKKV